MARVLVFMPASLLSLCFSFVFFHHSSLLTFTIWLRSGATIARIVWFAFYGFIYQAIFRVNRLPIASANFSSVDKRMSSA